MQKKNKKLILILFSFKLDFFSNYLKFSGENPGTTETF